MGSKKAAPPGESRKRAASLRAQDQAFRDFELAKPPSSRRARELWLQHAAGFILFEKVRAAGLATLESDATPTTRSAVELAVNKTLYALMMQIDGVASGLSGYGHELSLSFGVELRKGDAVVDKLDLFDGDGMCMGYHSWMDGDFGTDPVVSTMKKKGTRTRKPVRSRK